MATPHCWEPIHGAYLAAFGSRIPGGNIIQGGSSSAPGAPSSIGFLTFRMNPVFDATYVAALDALTPLTPAAYGYRKVERVAVGGITAIRVAWMYTGSASSHATGLGYVLVHDDTP